MKRRRDEVEDESKDSEPGRIIKYIKAVENEETEDITDDTAPEETKSKFIPRPLRTGT